MKVKETNGFIYFQGIDSVYSDACINLEKRTLHILDNHIDLELEVDLSKYGYFTDKYNALREMESHYEKLEQKFKMLKLEAINLQEKLIRKGSI